jgi:hypothetical protein
MLTYDVATPSRIRDLPSAVNMLVLGSSFAARSFVRYQVSNTRGYSSSAFKSFIRPRTPLDFFLLVTGAGAGWFGYDWFRDNYLRSDSTMQEKSPFDSEKFINFKLKQVIPYNHNTSKCVLTPLYV